MIRIGLTMALGALAAFAGTARAQGNAPAQGRLGTPNYDVVLQVPELSVDSIGLNVERLRAHVALDANAMNLVSLNAGVDVGIRRVRLEITGVLAEAYLYADLDNVTRIVARVVRTLDNNPEILTRLLSTVDTAVSTVGGVAGSLVAPGGAATRAVGAVGGALDAATRPGGLLGQTVNALGQTVQRTVSATGEIAERTLDTAGNVVGSRTLGSLRDAGDLELLQETPGADGRVVRRVRDASGAVIEYTLDRAGAITGARVVSPAPAGRR